MPFNDGIPKTNCFSLTDLHDFDFCQLRFFVRHHLDKKYELSEGNEKIALGNLLDQTIKIFHSVKAYGQPPSYVKNLVFAARNYILDYASQGKQPNFYSSTVPFLTPEVVQKAVDIFQNYYQKLDGKINQSLGEVGFCEFILSDEDGNKYKLWGGPDVFELGEDGVPEVIDYKSRENPDGRYNIDMDLMPKIYILLSAKYLLSKGYNKARFKAKIWQDPLNNSFYEEFNLNDLATLENLFRGKIKKIMATKMIKPCNKSFCIVCQSDKKDQYIAQLAPLGLNIQDNTDDLPF